MNKGVSFMDNDGLTQYMRIAISVAERIAAGELREGEKISGRSKLSSEYEVSPETVRRAIQLLSDMRVVAVKEQSGVYVLSADNAKRYLQNFENRADLMSKRRKLRELIEEKEALNRRMGELCQSILEDTLYPVQPAETLPTFSCRVPDGWYGIGKIWVTCDSGRRPALRWLPSVGAPRIFFPPAPTRSCMPGIPLFLWAKRKRRRRWNAS